MMANVPDRPDLSPEENETLRLMTEGMTSRQIAAELKVSVRTAETVIRKIYGKLKGGPDEGDPQGDGDGG